MDFLDPNFDGWLEEHETCANKVLDLSKQRERRGEYNDPRYVDAAHVVQCIAKVRILEARIRDKDATVDPSQINALVKEIKKSRRMIDAPGSAAS